MTNFMGTVGAVVDVCGLTLPMCGCMQPPASGRGMAQGQWAWPKRTKRSGQLWPLDLYFAVVGQAIAQVQVDEALIGHPCFIRHAFEVRDNVHCMLAMCGGKGGKRHGLHGTAVQRAVGPHDEDARP